MISNPQPLQEECGVAELSEENRAKLREEATMFASARGKLIWSTKGKTGTRKREVHDALSEKFGEKAARSRAQSTVMQEGMVKNMLVEKIMSNEMELKDVGGSDSGIGDGGDINDSLSCEQQVSARVQTMSAEEKNKYVKEFLSANWKKCHERAAVRDHLTKEKGTGANVSDDDVIKAIDVMPTWKREALRKDFQSASIKKGKERAAVAEDRELEELRKSMLSGGNDDQGGYVGDHRVRQASKRDLKKFRNMSGKNENSKRTTKNESIVKGLHHCIKDDHVKCMLDPEFNRLVEIGRANQRYEKVKHRLLQGDEKTEMLDTIKHILMAATNTMKI